MLFALLFATNAAAATGSPLGVGDTVRVDVYGEPDITRSARITPSCSIDLHFIGAVQVCGRTTDDVATEVQARLADGYLNHPAVLVSIQEYGSQRVELKGEIAQPGVQVLEGPTTLSQLITQAGGPTSQNVLQVQLSSQDQEPQFYDLSVVGTPGNTVWVRSGDVVTLLPPEYVFVHGEVANIGPVPYRTDLTATEALGLAGGPTRFASLGRAFIIRADGERLRVNIKRITRGEAADISLQPGDKLVVRQSVF